MQLPVQKIQLLWRISYSKTNSFAYILFNRNIYLGELSLYSNKPILHCKISQRYASSEVKKKLRFAVNLVPDIEDQSQKSYFNPKKHPGIHQINCVELPLPLQKIMKVIDKEQKDECKTKDFLQKAKDFYYHIESRQLPMEDQDIAEKMKEVKEKLLNKGVLSPISADPLVSLDNLTNEERNKIKERFKDESYNWKPIDYDRQLAKLYLTTRMAPDFASLKKIFSEIQKRIPDFKPKSLFDFGSGVGSVTWAMESVWPGNCSEALYVDSSLEMNNLSERIFSEVSSNCGGTKYGPKTVYYRNYLPASNTLKYDLVVSSRSMFEMGQMTMRVKIGDILWRKVNPGGFLVLVEKGNLQGHRLIMEIRDFLTEMHSGERKIQNNLNNYDDLKPQKDMIDNFQIFSPCPHEKFCPRIYHRSKTACYFPARYKPLTTNNAKNDYYSYVVIRNSPKTTDQSYSWPRVVQEDISKPRMCIRRLCTADGELKESVVTKGRHSKTLNNISKYTKWGDRYPIEFDSSALSEISDKDAADFKNSKHEFQPMESVSQKIDEGN